MTSIPDATVKRLQSDYTRLLTDPIEYIVAHPVEDNILEWYVFLVDITLYC
jgi:ubiquitin-protein ligase